MEHVAVDLQIDTASFPEKMVDQDHLIESVRRKDVAACELFQRFVANLDRAAEEVKRGELPVDNEGWRRDPSRRMVRTADFVAWARSGNLPSRESLTNQIQGLWITLPNVQVPKSPSAGLKAYLKLCASPPFGDYLPGDKLSWPSPKEFKEEIRAADPMLTEDEVEQVYSMFRDKRWIGRRLRKQVR